MGGVDWKRPRARIFRNECSGGSVEAGAREFERPSKPRPCLTPRVLPFEDLSPAAKRKRDYRARKDCDPEPHCAALLLPAGYRAA